VAKAALLRTESRGGHTRDDYPGMDAQWRNKLLVCSSTPDGKEATVTPKDQVPMREDLLELFEVGELEKYFTDDELARHSGRAGK
jgi:succinate dehydrogenase / fumarate reductase flavoprotein subunit